MVNPYTENRAELNVNLGLPVAGLPLRVMRAFGSIGSFFFQYTIEKPIFASWKVSKEDKEDNSQPPSIHFR